MKIASTIARYLLGVVFLTFGLNGFLHFIPMPPPTGVAAQFFGALFVSRLYIVIFLLQIACDPAACESLRPAGAYNSGASYFQHSLLSHFHGASRFAVGSFRRRSLDSRGFECLAGVQRYFATLRGRDENRNR
jgi:hypothetical protein